MIIGIMGSPIYSTNLGCTALSYSLIAVLEKIRKCNGLDFTYMFFDKTDDESKIREFCDKCNISRDKIITGTMLLLKSKKYSFFRLHKFCKMIASIKKCDVIVDLTGGDSFSDIYGRERFIGRTKVKILVSKCGTPLVLGPQTYGPFDEKNYSLAKLAIENAVLTIARDQISAKIVQKYSSKNIVVSTDLAFSLPYEKTIIHNEKKKIGINVNGMLYGDNYENVNSNQRLKVDYRKFIHKLINALVQDSENDIYLIPHVENDYLAIEEIKKTYANVKAISPFEDPISAKSFISGMDIFLGSRMHATIAAYTSGVPCIPVAYSRKFIGVYSLVGYPYVVDMEDLTTEEALDYCLDYIRRSDTIKSEMNQYLENGNIFKDKTYIAMEKCILSIIRQKGE